MRRKISPPTGPRVGGATKAGRSRGYVGPCLWMVALVWYFATSDGKGLLGPFVSLAQCQQIRNHYALSPTSGLPLLSQPSPCWEFK